VIRNGHPDVGRGTQDRRPELRTAVAEIGRMLDVAPPIAEPTLNEGALVSGRWTHGELHDRHAALNAHVIMTYYGAAQPIEWRDGRDRQASRTRPGSITVIPHGHAARWDIHGPIAVSHVYLSEQRLQASIELAAPGRRISLLDRVGFDDPVASRILEILADEATGANALPRLFVDQALDLLCLQLIRGHSTLGSLAPPGARRGMPGWQVRRVSEFMTEHLADDIGLDQLAGVAGLSRFHFCTTFRQATGQTPYQWFTALRMTRACELLRGPEMTIAQVALAVGYDTPSAFAAAFRRREGRSPSEFRRELSARPGSRSRR
jgi:AraC family transcriptional regulator